MKKYGEWEESPISEFQFEDMKIAQLKADFKFQPSKPVLTHDRECDCTNCRYHRGEKS